MTEERVEEKYLINPYHVPLISFTKRTTKKSWLLKMTRLRRMAGEEAGEEDEVVLLENI